MLSTRSRHGVLRAVAVTIFLILPASAMAQQFGVKGGVNFASLTPEEDEDPDDSRRLGPVGGVWVRTPAASRLSFQLEGLFSEKGVKVKAPQLGLDAGDVRLRYLEIPALARADFGASGAGTHLFVVGGAAPAFKLAAHATAEGEGQKSTRNIDDDIYGFDVGLVGGLGVEFGRALIEARYTHGLRHINTDDNGDEDRIKNRVFGVMVGFRVW